MQDIRSNYTEHLKQTNTHLAKLALLNTRLSVLRLGLFVVAFVGFYFLFAWNWQLATGFLSVFIIAFLFVVKFHLKKEKQLEFAKRKAALLEKELSYQDFTFSEFPDGAKFEPEKHDYASDLDLFGKHSLFQYINRAVTFFGQNKLADWLLKSATKEEIEARQEAVKELSEKSRFRTNYLCTLQGLDNDLLPQLKKWSETEEKPTPLFFRVYLLTYVPLIWLSLLLSIWIPFFSSVFPYLFGINAFFLIRYANFFMREHSNVSKTGELLSQVSSALSKIEKENFGSQSLNQLQAELKEDRFITHYIQKLSKHIASWDYRLNMIVYIIVAMLFVWDVYWMWRVNRWKAKHKTLIGKAIDTLAEMEALVSLGTAHYNHPSWVFPEIKEGVVPKFEQIGHPLLRPQQRVDNNFQFRFRQELVFVSGSNMSGKSTFLRSVGVNLVLAQMGAPVCARSMSFFPVRIFTIMRIKDSLEENTSTFYFEIKRIKQLLNEVETHPNVFYLLDELLRGTNSHDKHFGTKAIIEWLIQRQGLGFIASHDLGLSEMESNLERFSNYHFDVQIDNNKMDFDYKLRKGACSVFNASLLLREIGIVVEE